MFSCAGILDPADFIYWSVSVWYIYNKTEKSDALAFHAG